jgi:hypothetical protein
MTSTLLKFYDNVNENVNQEFEQFVAKMALNTKLPVLTLQNKMML